MDFAEKINDVLRESQNDFEEWLDEQLDENPHYLSHSHWVSDDLDCTVLNYLITQHKGNTEDNNDLTQQIDYVVSRMDDRNLGEPLHLALSLGRIGLAAHLIEQDEKKAFSLNQRDMEGRTLLSLVLNTCDERLLKLVQEKGINMHQATRVMKGTNVSILNPLQQAIELDFAVGVTALIEGGVQLTATFGKLNETPVLMAARKGKINALEALLAFPKEQLNLEKKNNSLVKGEEGYTAVEELCKRVQQKRDAEEAIRGIAMLLCRGAEPPHNEDMRKLLSANRSGLLKAIDQYLADKPDCVDAFVQRCHLKETALHNIIYADHSWGSSIRHLFGIPSEAALAIEQLVTRKYNDAKQPQAVSFSASAGSIKPGLNKLQLYAEFVRRYTQAYSNQRITNPWSSMRWMISEGKADWDMVRCYAETYPKSRTGIIIAEMFPSKIAAHESLHEDVLAESPNPK